MKDAEIKTKVMKWADKMIEGIPEAESYKSGLIGEGIIVSAFKTLPISELEKLRFVLNQIIEKKKILRRANDRDISEN